MLNRMNTTTFVQQTQLDIELTLETMTAIARFSECAAT